MISKTEIFESVYAGYRNKLTPRIFGYYGSIRSDGHPDKSRFICELSEGVYNTTVIYGVTVIEYHDSRGWKRNLSLSGVTTSKEKAKKYASELGLKGCFSAGCCLL